MCLSVTMYPTLCPSVLLRHVVDSHRQTCARQRVFAGKTMKNSSSQLNNLVGLEPKLGSMSSTSIRSKHPVFPP